MKLKKTKSFFIAVFLLALSSFPAGAEDFTFHVPINLQSLHPDVSRIQVSCYVFPTQGVDWSNKLGQKIIYFDRPANGNFSQTVTVAFDADSGKNPGDAKHYLCKFNLESTVAGTAIANPSFSHNKEWAKAKEGTNFDMGVDGPIP